MKDFQFYMKCLYIFFFFPEMTQSNTIVHRQLRGKNTSNAD